MADHPFAVWRCEACRGFLVLPSTGAVTYSVSHPPPGKRWQADKPGVHDVVCLGRRELVDRPAVLAAYTMGGPEAVSAMEDPPCQDGE